MKITIIGGGWVGCHLAKQLKNDHEITLIEKDDEIISLQKRIDSLKSKPIKVIEKEKPKFLFTRTKKDTTKTPVKPIVVPVVTTPVDTNSH